MACPTLTTVGVAHRDHECTRRVGQDGEGGPKLALPPEGSFHDERVRAGGEAGRNGGVEGLHVDPRHLLDFLAAQPGAEG
jgi:hypothetical protein